MPQKKVTGANNAEYNTPSRIFSQCDRIWGPFDLDVAASDDNTKCERWFIEHGDTNGLTGRWFGKCWMNPPYGSTELYQWCSKAFHEVEVGDTILVCSLLPAKPEQRWWCDWVDARAQYVQFITGRLTFDGARQGAQFPSVVVVWHKRIVR